jgi:hypothetical protein
MMAILDRVFTQPRPNPVVHRSSKDYEDRAQRTAMMDTLTPENLSKSTEGSSSALFSARQVSVAAFLGAALGGGWLMFKNFGAIGDEVQKQTAMFGSLLLTVIIVVGAM